MLNLVFKSIALGQCRYGVMLWPNKDDTIGRALDLYGEFSECCNTLMLRYVKGGDTVIDVGANLGTTVLPLSLAVGQAGRVIAYEPQHLIAQCLSASLMLNEFFNVELLVGAAGKRFSWVRFSAKSIDEAGNYGGANVSEDGLKVPLFLIDDLDISSCSLLKIDVEGYEWEVLQGAREALLHFHPVVYFEAFPQESTVSCLNWLMENNWECFWHFSYFYNPDNFKKNKSNVFGALGDINVLAVPFGKECPKDLPRIKDPREDWKSACEEFYRGCCDGQCE